MNLVLIKIRCGNGDYQGSGSKFRNTVILTCFKEDKQISHHQFLGWIKWQNPSYCFFMCNSKNLFFVILGNWKQREVEKQVMLAIIKSSQKQNDLGWKGP